MQQLLGRMLLAFYNLAPVLRVRGGGCSGVRRVINYTLLYSATKRKNLHSLPLRYSTVSFKQCD